MTIAGRDRFKELERKNPELKCANEIFCARHGLLSPGRV